MSRQAQGPIGWLVERMVQRSLCKAFHNVWWNPPPTPLPQPCVLIANHHGWHDGYVLYHAIRVLNLPTVVWMEELEAFPPFKYIGGLTFPRENQGARTATIRRTVRLLRSGQANLALFPEGAMHRPPGLLPFTRALEFLCKKVQGLSIVPVGLRYEVSMHERPECFLSFGQPTKDPEEARISVLKILEELESAEPDGYELLLAGTKDVNERWDMRRLGARKGT
ncbi:MAG TPA: lysophospholipid acyltransferase family protein [Fimbriimonas sp.]|nr:lysophospholipid acyltransferase family protein [Fimbriimonas sp.]